MLIDAISVFNQMNRAVTMHNIQMTCIEMVRYIINTYKSLSRLFICGVWGGVGGILSQEGTTPRRPASHALVLSQYINLDKKPENEHTRSETSMAG